MKFSFSGLFKKSAGSSRVLTSEDLAEVLAHGNETSSGMRVDSSSALRLATVFACVRVLADNVGVLPFQLFKRDGEDREIDRSHPLYTLLHDAPNEFQTSQEWREYMMAHLALKGSAYSFINRPRKKGPVVELLPIHPDHIEPKLSDDFDLVYRAKFGGQETTLMPEEVLHLKAFTFDGINGVSPITYAREAIGTALATQAQGGRTFGNGSTPRGVIELDHAFKDEEEAKEFRKKWDEMYTGVHNAHRVAILQNGLKWKEMAMSAVDAQYIESRKFERSDIAAFFRVPPHMVNDLERATFSNIEHISLEFVTQTLVPWLRKFENAANQKLLLADERKEYFTELNVDGLLRGDAKGRSELYSKGIQWGWFSPNDVRRMENLNAREGGNTYLQPTNMAPSVFVPAGTENNPGDDE